MFHKHHKHVYAPPVRVDTMAVRVKRDIERQRDYLELCERLRRDWMREH